MLYQWYELNHAAVRPARVAADSYRLFFNNPFNPMSHTAMGRSAAAACEVFERTTRQYAKPDFGICTTTVDGEQVQVEEEVVWQRPFCRLLHFKRAIPGAGAGASAQGDPRILIVAPMSGHYATLLRGTVEALLPDHEVFITDWLDARNVPLDAGRFDLSDYINYMRDLFRHFGGNVHVVSVCQPSVPVLAAVALMEADDEPDVPASMVLMGGPVDTRISKTAVNELAEKRGTAWFARNVIVNVPWTNPGHGRKVYPGFLQLGGFMTMNLNRHVKAHKDMFFHLVHGDGDGAEKHRDFYDEYLAVMDLTAEFFLQTIETVFVKHQLAKGEMVHQGRRIDLGAIKRVALMTVEGEKDDITGIGQCAAAQQLCSNLAADKKIHYECPGVGHYGIFNGRRFRKQIVPRIADFVRRHDARAYDLPAVAPREPDMADQRAGGHKSDPSGSAFSFASPRSFARRPAKASAPDTSAPDTSAPDTSAPDTSAPDTSAPDTSAPDAPAQRVRPTGRSGTSTSTRRRRSASHVFAAHAALLRIWGLTGAMFFANPAQTRPVGRARRNRPVQHRRRA